VIQQDIIANNLANLNTTGFKSGKIFLRLLEVAGSSEDLLQSQETFDFSQGDLKRTGNPWDLALQGQGFFVTESSQGLHYTRNGSFRLNGEGLLTTYDGALVLGERGPIQVTDEISVNDKGELFADGVLVDRLRIIGFESPARLRKMSDSMFQAVEDAGVPFQPESTKVKQGFLEQSNVNPIREMVAMINVFRIFEADARALKAQDETLGRAVNEVGQVR
jgi:flagellar basal-body rod protein FlgG